MLQRTKPLKKFRTTLQHRYVEMTSYMTSSKMPFTDKDGHLTKAFQKEKTCHCKSIAERISEQNPESSLIKSLSKKIDKFGSVW